MPRSASGARWRPRTAGLSEATAAADGKSRRRGLGATDAAAHIERCCSRAATVLGVLCAKMSLPGCSPLRLLIERLLGDVRRSGGAAFCAPHFARRIRRCDVCVETESWETSNTTELNLGKQAATRIGILRTKQQHWFPKEIGNFPGFRRKSLCCLILKIAFSVFACFARFCRRSWHRVWHRTCHDSLRAFRRCCGRCTGDACGTRQA